MESIEWADIGNKTRTFVLEHFPHGLVAHLGVLVRLRIIPAPIFKSGVQFGIGFELRARHEEPPPEHTDLVLDLPLLPPRGRGAGNRFDQVMPKHLLEPPVIGPVLAHEDRINGGLNVVIDAPRTGTTKESKRLVVGVKHHLSGLARIGPDKRHPAMAQTDMRDLDGRGDAIDQNNFMAPVKLIGFTGIKTQWHIGSGGRFSCRLRPTGFIPAHRIIAAVLASIAQLLVNPNQCQPLALGLPVILGQHLVQVGPPRINLRARLRGPVIAELGRARPDHLAHRVPRHPQFPADLLDRLPLNKTARLICAIVSTTNIPNSLPQIRRGSF